MQQADARVARTARERRVAKHGGENVAELFRAQGRHPAHQGARVVGDVGQPVVADDLPVGVVGGLRVLHGLLVRRELDSPPGLVSILKIDFEVGVQRRKIRIGLLGGVRGAADVRPVPQEGRDLVNETRCVVSRDAVGIDGHADRGPRWDL